MSEQFNITWRDRGGPPQVPPNPQYPEGIDIDGSLGAEQTCLAKLPYPTGHKNIGTWFVTCTLCGLTVAVTAASRPDDPRSIKLPCKVEVGHG